MKGEKSQLVAVEEAQSVRVKSHQLLFQAQPKILSATSDEFPVEILFKQTTE